jgi:hypothetical protein
MTFVTAAVEGDVDAAVVRRLVDVCDGEAYPIHITNGKARLKSRLDGYNAAAQYTPWFVIADLDRDADCAPPFVNDWLAAPADGMCFRVAVRAVEAWLIADRERFRRLLRVPISRIPRDPDAIEDPKRLVVALARNSTSTNIKSGLVPRPGSGRTVGPLYTSTMIQFAQLRWRPSEARQRSDSLDRCLNRLASLVGPR